MGISFYFSWEAELIKLIQSFLTPFLTAVLSFITKFGEETVIVLLLAYIYWCRDKRFGEKMAVNILTSTVFCPMLKNLFFRLRPYFVIPEIDCLDPAADGDLYDTEIQGFSFPSGHSCSASTAYGTLRLYVKKSWKRILLVILIIFVGISRFCLGVHFPTDVLAGLLLGMGVIALNAWMDRHLSTTAHYLAIMAAGTLGLFFCLTEDYYTGYGVMIGGLAGMLFEKRYVCFENTDSVIISVLRVLCGLMVFLVINLSLKAVLAAFGESEALMVLRSLRYCLSSFITVGVYPISFRLEKRLKVIKDSRNGKTRDMTIE